MFKILEQNGVDNENIDGSAFNRFTAGGKDGVIAGILNECRIFSQSSTINVNTGELLVCGFRIKNTNVFSIQMQGTPAENIRYQLVAQITLSALNDVSFSIFARTITALQQDNLYAGNGGIYQIELGRFTHSTQGSVIEVAQTVDVIDNAGRGGDGQGFILGTVTTQTISSILPAEVDIDERTDEQGRTVQDFKFSFPATVKDVITIPDFLLYLQTGKLPVPLTDEHDLYITDQNGNPIYADYKIN